MKTPEKEIKKIIRKDASRIGWGLSIYTVISASVVMLSFIIAMVYLLINNPEVTEQDAVYVQMMEQCEKSGTFSIIGVCLGTLFLVFFLRKRITISTIMQNGKKMGAVGFGQIFGIFLGAQAFFTLFGGLLEQGLNLFGYSALQDMETATEVSTTVSMFLYASVVGPIVEEVIYRGFILRSLEKYGKLLAILVSSILFGIMHVNLPQGFFAFGIGLVLGYVAIEYSLKWAIVLHVINNCIISDVLGWFLARFSAQTQDIVSNILLGIYGIMALILLFKKRNTIKEYISNNRVDKGVIFCIFTSVGMLVFVGAELFFTFVMLERV